ncbi:MAG TPA: DUF255 domain-containing protein [Saprospiraceae bacterium]|nr:DUF255 domain-containing protein [Saprospiraceae bacterium]HNA93496.1 DUF255 domain-containing protein [Saprospiraceae bacterium]HND96778.1 DUF255 domain-containing protein [Chitinophagaceae bacterium]HNE65875.1 DUF255 domain-containing protein [Saprospiraceae bacterium]HNG13517.1 DUF255 domain-containing protein [Saprospiraceae bacterium]
MKTYFSGMFVIAMMAVASFAFCNNPIKGGQTAASKVKWYTWAEAMELRKQNPKPIMVDLYTDWCGWCKRMDATTFEDEKVAKYLNDNFYPVKFDAEQKGEITYGGKLHKFVASGRNGYHELAAAMVDGQLGYPCFVYFNENMERIMFSPGYKGADDVMKELMFAAEGKYKTTSWDAYKAAK